MLKFNKLNEIRNIDDTVVVLGNFDGVHLGHQQLIEKGRKMADDYNCKLAVFSFSNHPKNLIRGEGSVKSIIYIDEKLNILRELNVDYFFNIPFTEDIMTMSPGDFIRELVVNKFNAIGVVCGFNYRFGYKAKGDLELLEKLGLENNFIVEIIPPFMVEGEVVSSTLIRELIKAGDMSDISKFLGRNYSIEGEVVVGNKIGRTIGFPTSNVNIQNDIITPPNGVYVTYCIYNGIKYPSITNVGTKPTIGKFKKNIETHIFNFDRELYGKKIKVEFVKMTREEVKFNNLEQLKEQIKKDCNEVKSFHAKHLNKK